jgi:hypothetical protein
MHMGFARVGDFCPNETCPDYEKMQSDQQRNIKKAGKTKKGRQRYQCKTCGLTFIAEGVRISSLARVKGHKEDTISDWLRTAAQHAEEIEEILLAEYQLDQGQLVLCQPFSDERFCPTCGLFSPIK